jgi:hypothetical protein
MLPLLHDKQLKEKHHMTCTTDMYSVKCKPKQLNQNSNGKHLKDI